MIHVIAAIEVKDGQRDAFLAEFHKVVAPTRAEVGCLEYGPTIDVASGLSAQGPLRANVVTVVEKWESLEALQRHLQAAHMLAYRERVKDHLVGVRLQVLQPA